MTPVQTYSVMDACALIAFLQGEPGSDVVEGVLLDPAKQKAVHAINLCEMYYHFLRQNDQATAETSVNTITGLKVAVREDMDGAFWRRVAQLKGSYKLSLGDCCCLALAERLNAELVTSDHHEFDAIVPLGLCPILFIR